MLDELGRPRKLAILSMVITFFVCIFLILLSRSVQKGYNHDEHQFVASGKVLADKSLLPYRDYPYFQMPNLVFVYASIFKFFDHILLGARVFNVVCEVLTFGLIFGVAFSIFPQGDYPSRWLLAAGSVIILLSNPLFMRVSGRAWNHALPILLTLLAFVFHCHGSRQEPRKRWLFLSGVSLGLAVGTRITFAPAVPAFFGVIFSFPNVADRRTRHDLILWFTVGLFLALLPSLVTFMIAPKQFAFGNIGFRLLDMTIREKMGYQRAMTLAGKVVYFMDLIRNKNSFLPVLAFIVFVFSRNVRAKTLYSFELMFVLILIPCLFIGCFVPTPSNPQYFYAPVPFLVLGTVYAIASFGGQGEKLKWRIQLFALLIAASAIYGLYNYRHLQIANLVSPDEWFPIRVHRIGVKIKSIIGGGKVLTLAPLFPLEGGVEIYEEFVTGPFAWRPAPLIPRNERKVLRVIAYVDLDEFLRTQPPRAILVGFESELEWPFVKYAKENGYKALKLADQGILFLPSY